MLWDKEYKDEGWSKAIIETSDNTIIAAGLNMYKTNSQGILKWNIDFLNYPGESVYMIEVDESAVLAFGTQSWNNRLFLAKVRTSSGTFFWKKYLDGYKFKPGNNCLAKSSDGGFIMAGNVYSQINNEDLVLIKTDSEGNILKTFAPNISKKSSTYQFYPNPFSNQTVLKTNGSLSNAILTIYTSLGNKIKQLNHISGQSFILSRDNLANGLYFYNLTEENKIIATGKLEVIDN